MAEKTGTLYKEIFKKIYDYFNAPGHVCYL